MKTTTIITSMLAATALTLVAVPSTEASAIVEYLFNETGTTAFNTGSAASADLTLGSSPDQGDTHGPGGLLGSTALDHAFGDTSISARGITPAGEVSELDGLFSFTMTGWYDSERSNGLVGNERRLIDTGSSDDLTFRLEGGESGPNQDMLRLRVEGMAVVSGAGTYPADGDELVFFAVSYDGTLTANNALFYRGTQSGGVSLVATQTINAGALDTAGSMRVGVGGRLGFNAPRTFHGTMDNVRIFGSTTDDSGALGLGEIDQVFQGDLIPEPASLALLALGAGLLSLVRRRT